MTVGDIFRHFYNYFVVIEDFQYTLYIGRLENIPLDIMEMPVNSVFITKREEDIILNISVL